jgi:protocatechuate 3,4-dioxygenase beta subunit
VKKEPLTPRAHDRRDTEAVEPPYSFPSYGSTRLRAPLRPAIRSPYGPVELAESIPIALLAAGRSRPSPDDLTRQHAGEPLGERIIVHGRVLNAAGRPIPNALIEIWQANAAGRYAHEGDQHPAPLDPHFTGAGSCLTNARGEYHFVTIKPGAYPWRNHENAWRPAHIHFSVLGASFSQRLMTQMYFPGDPLLDYDPIFASVPRVARAQMVAAFDLAKTMPEWALAYRFDLVFGGRSATGGATAGER